MMVNRNITYICIYLFRRKEKQQEREREREREREIKIERGDASTMKRSFTVRVGMLKEGEASDLWDSLRSRKLFASSNASRAARTSVHLGGTASAPNKGSRDKKMNVDIVQNEHCDANATPPSFAPRPLFLSPVVPVWKTLVLSYFIYNYHPFTVKCSFIRITDLLELW